MTTLSEALSWAEPRAGQEKSPMGPRRHQSGQSRVCDKKKAGPAPGPWRGQRARAGLPPFSQRTPASIWGPTRPGGTSRSWTRRTSNVTARWVNWNTSRSRTRRTPSPHPTDTPIQDFSAPQSEDIPAVIPRRARAGRRKAPPRAMRDGTDKSPWTFPGPCAGAGDGSHLPGKGSAKSQHTSCKGAAFMPPQPRIRSESPFLFLEKPVGSPPEVSRSRKGRA